MGQMMQSQSTVKQRTPPMREQVLKLLAEYEDSGFTIKEFTEMYDLEEALLRFVYY